MSRVDRILETIDAGLGSSWEDDGRIVQDRCVGCQYRAPKEGSSWCGPCHPGKPVPALQFVALLEALNRGDSASTYVRLYAAGEDEEVAW